MATVDGVVITRVRPRSDDVVKEVLDFYGVVVTREENFADPGVGIYELELLVDFFGIRDQQGPRSVRGIRYH